jgi:hypothetical protein
MNKKEDLLEAIKNMNRAQLTQYHSAATLANKCVDTIGVTIIFLLLWLSNLAITIPAVIFLYIIANISAGLGETINYIEKRMLRPYANKEDEPVKKNDEVDK